MPSSVRTMVDQESRVGDDMGEITRLAAHTKHGGALCRHEGVSLDLLGLGVYLERRVELSTTQPPIAASLCRVYTPIHELCSGDILVSARHTWFGWLCSSCILDVR